MSVSERRVVFSIIATDTHCGAGLEQCIHVDAPWKRCNGFYYAGLELDLSNGQFKRLDECKAAEQRQITSDYLNMRRLQIDDPEVLEARVNTAKAEIAAMTEKLATIQRILGSAK